LQGGTQIRGQISKPKESLGHERISTIVFFKTFKRVGTGTDKRERDSEIRGRVGWFSLLSCSCHGSSRSSYISTYIYIYKIYTPGMGPRKEYLLGLAGDQNW